MMFYLLDGQKAAGCLQFSLESTPNPSTRLRTAAKLQAIAPCIALDQIDISYGQYKVDSYS
jgi:hypothetical protein